MLQGVDVENVNPHLEKLKMQFIGILSGIIASIMYNRFSHVQLPDALPSLVEND